MLNLQQQCFNDIKALCSNYKKDGADRKTEEYLLKRLQSLQDKWNDFEERHRAIVDTHKDRSIAYFAEDVFTKTMELYETTKNSMQNFLQQIRERKTVHFDLSGMLDETTDVGTKTLLEQQECNFKALDRVMSKIDIKTTLERWELQDYLSTLKSKWEIIDKLHWELEVKLKGSNLKYYNMFTAVEGKYDDLRRQLNAKMWSTTHYEKSVPKIEIPEFSGSYTQWISFKDLFLETIHNNHMINKAQKMQHLKAKLRGEAERLVQHLGISADNYDSCWEILAQRYDNRRIQFTSFINTMLNLPVIQNPDSYNLKHMHDVITECLNGLSNIDINTATWDPLIVHLMSQKLDISTYSEYTKEQQDHRELPNLNDFLYFLEGKFMAYETVKNAKKGIPETKKQSQPTFSNYKKFSVQKQFNEIKKTYNKTYFTTSFEGQCPHCSGSHVLMQCPKFIDMNSIQRHNTVAKLHLCKNCLYSHGSAKCSSNKTCKECNMKHHTLLHNYTNKILPTTTETNCNEKYQNISRPSTSTQLSSNHLTTDEIEILLTTVQLRVLNANGNYVTLRALLDQGSQVNLITESAAQLLKIPRQRLTATVSGIGTTAGDCQGSLQLTCKSIHSDYTFKTQALIMKKLINNLPNSSFKTADWPHLENLKLADPEFNVSRSVDLLLGADVYSDIILDGVLKGSQQAPTAQQTHLGWILCGKLKTFKCHVALVELNDITKYCEHEDITQDDKDSSKDDYCDNHYSRTVRRASDERYIVQMPLVTNYEEKLGKSKPVAISQYLQLERRFQRKNKLAVMYRDFIDEYVDLCHMKPSPSSTTTSNDNECYLPHHGVLREHSSTTKLRVVFNAPQKTSSGLSLNELQERGPNLQKEIQALILKWRSYKYIGDIEKMYRCICICKEQQKLQKRIKRNPSSIASEISPPTTTLLDAKTRAAPIADKLTLPQLELGGALLLAQSFQKTKGAFKGHVLTIQAWSDFQVGLAWLQGDISSRERYVANRNDTYPSKLLNFELWWKGPEFIYKSKKDNTSKKAVCATTTDVIDKLKTVTTLAEKQDNNFIHELLNKCSSLLRVTRITAWVLRFIANGCNDTKLNTHYLRSTELAYAKNVIIKCVQRNEFKNEYKQLKNKQIISNKSALYKLTPYIDDKGIIRVGGRLNNSTLPTEMKNPIILSRNGRFTKLLIEQAHSATLHGGARLTLSYIRQRYWIVGGNRAVKDNLRHCVRCHRHKPTETYQLMGDLPQQRITPSRPFTHSGVDFTGHVEIKLNKGRGVKTSKGYIAIFVCMATKAVHIELVSDLSTETFLAAFQRMCARRGTPKHVYSDCGTNFLGAARVLRKEFEEFKQLLTPAFFDEISKLEVEWHFNAPAWPTGGGLWETAVRSLKHHLRRVLGEQRLTYEEFSTLLAQIEACMNSRPLCPLTEDPEEFYNYLTPGHFLTGAPTLSLPLSDYSDIRTLDLRRRWQLTENMLQQFWRNWSNEYLTQLQSRSKWSKPTKNIEEGDIVLVRESNLPPGKWAMGRVVKVHPGTDGLVRVTTLKTQAGFIKRPITKLSPLPMKLERPEN